MIRNLDELGEQLEEEDVTLLLDGPGEGPGMPATSLRMLSGGHLGCCAYRERVERYNQLKEKHSPDILQKWLDNHPEYEERREQEKKANLARTKRGERFALALNVIVAGLLVIHTFTYLKIKKQVDETSIETKIGYKNEFAIKKAKEMARAEQEAYKGYKDKIFYLSGDNENDGLVRFTEKPYFNPQR